MTALWAIVLIVLIGLIGTCLLVALVVFKAIPGAFNTLDRMQARHTQQMDKLLDRLMTIRWEDYVSTRELTTEEDGGFFAPDELAPEGYTPPSDVEVVEPGRWGHLSALRDAAEREEHEEELLQEDFR